MKNKKTNKDNKKKQDYENLYKRALADYQNLQKQTAKEKQEFAKYANANLILEILPIYENLKTAVEHSEEDNQWLEGVQYVVKQFEYFLQNNGVEVINPKGQEFNPAEHEAVEQVETENKKQVNKVAKVVKLGYKMYGKVLQAAKVAVFSCK